MPIVHDLSLAKMYVTDTLLLDEGHFIASGKIDQILTSDRMSAICSTDACMRMQRMFSNRQS